MAVLTREEFFSHINDTIGNDTSDSAMQFIEDMTDTYNAMESKANGSGVDWEQKYRDLDNAWKEKYKRRFFSSGGRANIPESLNENDDDDNDGSKRAKNIAIKDLFQTI